MGFSHEYKRTTWGRAITLHGNARKRSKKRGVEVYITVEWIEEHLKRGTCELTGIPFSFEPPPEGYTRRQDAPSLDRIDKTKPYTPENTRVILWAVNCALAEYGTHAMLPILERMVHAIKEQPAPIPTQHTGEGETNPALGVVHGARIGEDCDGSLHHRGESEGQNLSHSPQASCRICLGSRERQVESSKIYERREDYGVSEAEARHIAKLLGCVCYQH